MKKKKAPKKTRTTKTANVPTFESLPELCTPEEAGAFLRISRNTTYELLKTGKLPSIHFGRLIRIPKTALMAGGR